MKLKLWILVCAGALIGIFAAESLAQPVIEPLIGKDDERIWFQWDVQGRLEQDETSYRGGRLSFHIEGLLEPLVYDDTSLIGFVGDDLPFTLNVETCTRIDENDGSTVLTCACRTNPAASTTIKLLFNLDNGYSELNFDTFDLGICVTSGPNIERTESEMNYGHWFSSSIEVPDSFTIFLTRKDLQGDFEKSYTYDIRYSTFFECPLGGQGRMTLRSRPPDETKVTLAGCANIMIGVAAEITATAKPEGGTYTWTCEPADIFSISGSGSTATVTGKSAGHATIRVEYQPKKGKKVEATLPGSVVELLSVNGGAEIPQIGLYDETGAAKPAVQVPTVQDPPDVGLLSFPTADPGVATVDNLGSGISIKGVSEGTTTAQGKTPCGDKDEHIIAIEVVPCDKETIQKLRDQMKELEEQLNEIKNQIKSIINDPELQRVLREKDRLLTTMAVKALGVFTSAAGEGTMGDIADFLGEIYDLTEEGTWSGRWSIKDMYIKNQINLAKKLTMGIINDLIEYGEAGLEVGHGMDVMKAATEALKEAYQRRRELTNEWNEIHHRRTAICDDYEDDESEPAEHQPTEPPPTDPQPPTPQPTELPPTDPEPIEPTGEDEPTAPDDDDIIVEPPQPTPYPGGGGGFPIDCGCSRWDQSGWGNSSDGFEMIGRDIGSLVPCLEDFNRNSVRPMEITNDTTVQLFENMEQALTLPETQRVEAFRGFMPLMNDLKVRYTQFGNEFKSMSDSLGQCSPAIQRAGEIIGTVGE